MEALLNVGVLWGLDNRTLDINYDLDVRIEKRLDIES